MIFSIMGQFFCRRAVMASEWSLAFVSSSTFDKVACGSASAFFPASFAAHEHRFSLDHHLDRRSHRPQPARVENGTELLLRGQLAILAREVWRARHRSWPLCRRPWPEAQLSLWLGCHFAVGVGSCVSASRPSPTSPWAWLRRPSCNLSSRERPADLRSSLLPARPSIRACCRPGPGNTVGPRRASDPSPAVWPERPRALASSSCWRRWPHVRDGRARLRSATAAEIDRPGRRIEPRFCVDQERARGDHFLIGIQSRKYGIPRRVVRPGHPRSELHYARLRRPPALFRDRQSSGCPCR